MRRVDQPESNLINKHIMLVKQQWKIFSLPCTAVAWTVCICKAGWIFLPFLSYWVQTLSFHFHLQRYSTFWIIIKMTVLWETTLFIFKHPDLSLIFIIFSFAHPEPKCNSSPALWLLQCFRRQNAASNEAQMLPLTQLRGILVKCQGIVTPCMGGSAEGSAWMSNLSGIQWSALGKDVLLLVFATGFSCQRFLCYLTGILSVSAWNQHPLQCWPGTELLCH